MNEELRQAILDMKAAVDAYHKRQAAKAIVGALANLNYNLPPQPSSETIDGWTNEEIDGWWAETEPLLPNEVEG